MAQHYIEWYSVHTNSVALREMAWRNVEWYSLHTSLQNIRRSNWTLNRLVLHEIFRCCGESSSLLMAWREDNLAEAKFKFNCASVLHILIVHSHDISKQIPREKNFPSGWKCYKTIGSYVSCAFMEIWSTWEVWRALKKLKLLSAMPRATLTHLSCSPNFPRASYLDERTRTCVPIVNYDVH